MNGFELESTLKWANQTYKVDFNKATSLAIPIQHGDENPNAWYCDPVSITPVINEFFTGDVSRGGPVNFRNIFFNPHGNGTHTEGVGHISKEPYSVHTAFSTYHFPAALISITPELHENGDFVITSSQFEQALSGYTQMPPAIVLRTLPNTIAKKTKAYSNTNPPYVEAEALGWLRAEGVAHFLIDLPSVDREFDDGKLAGHHTFWTYPEQPRTQATITELIFVPDILSDGLYLIYFQLAPFVNDATPSQPILYPLTRL